MKKHAYLVIAHKVDYTFKTLLQLLDDERNDIFVHMDKKTKNVSFDEISSVLKKSTIYFTKVRENVTWGGYSGIKTELILLAEATSKQSYQYYHLISGEDLPIKTQQQIHDFFDRIEGKQLIRFENEIFKYCDRVQYYHLFQELIGRPKSRFIYQVSRAFISLQKIIGVTRNSDVLFQKGTNWFSITDELARYVVDMEPWIKKVFAYSQCGDEVFLQTLVHNSRFKNQLYRNLYDNNIISIMRLIDWNRGNPYVFRNFDKKELSNSTMLFARKFDCMKDREVIDYVKNNLVK